jgi:hypothetical protein
MFNLQEKFSQPENIGELIRDQLGRRHMLVAEPVGFRCNWHRMVEAGETNPTKEPTRNYRFEGSSYDDYPPSEAEADFPEKRLACEEGATLKWPRTVRLEQLAPLSWPGLKLPDGRRVLFVPEAKSVGILLPHAWNDLRRFAKASRGPLISHAYAVTLGVLQYWKVRGSEMVQRREDRKAWIKGGKNQWEFDLAADPKGRDEKIETWMYHWARHLHDNPPNRFRPSVEAIAVLSRTIGYTASGIESIIRRGR